LYDSGKQDSEKSGRKPRHHHGAQSQYGAMKRVVFMESCLLPLHLHSKAKFVFTLSKQDSF
jgi:hypothetical protein